MGASRDAADGVLRDSLGRTIEAEKNWQISLGYTRDALGRLHNAQGQLVEGLSQTEQKLGMYKDALGNVYDAQDNCIRQGKEFTEGLRFMANGLLSVANLAITFSAGSSEAARKTRVMTAAFGSFSSAVALVPQITKWYKTLTLVTDIQTGAIKRQSIQQGILNGLKGNWLTLGVGLAAGIGTAVMISQMEATAEAAEKAKEKIENLTDAQKKFQKEEEQQKLQEEERRKKLREDAEKAGQSLVDRAKSDEERYHEQWIADKELIEARLQLEKEFNEKKKRLTSGTIEYEIEENKRLTKEKIAELEKRDAYNIRFSPHKQTHINRRNVDIRNVNTQSAREIAKLQQELSALEAEIKQGLTGTSAQSMQIARFKLDEQHAVKLAEKAEKRQQEIDKLMQPLKEFATQTGKQMKEVEKKTKEWAWLDDITVEIRRKMTAEQKAAYKEAREERNRQLKNAKLRDEMSDEQIKLMEQINAYVSPMEQFTARQGLLNDLLENAPVSLEGWLDAVEKNKQALYSSSKYNTFIQQAIENAKSYEEKKAEGILDITKRMTKAGETLTTIDDAVRLFVEKLDADALKQKAEQVVNRDLAAAEAGSLEAYKIINGNREDKQVKAIKEQTKEIVASHEKVIDAQEAFWQQLAKRDDNFNVGVLN